MWHLWKSDSSASLEFIIWLLFSFVIWVFSDFWTNTIEFFNVRVFQNPYGHHSLQIFLLSFLVSLSFASSSHAAVMLKHSREALPCSPPVKRWAGQVCVKLNTETCQWSSGEPFADRPSNDISLGMRSFLLPAVLRMQAVSFQGYRGTGEWGMGLK